MSHRPDQVLDALLAGYASGVLGAPLHVLVAGHLALNPSSRALVADLEVAGGAALERSSPVPVSRRESRLAAIFETPAEPITRPVSPLIDGVLPRPVARYIGCTLAQMAWQPFLPGIRKFKVEATAHGEVALYRIRPGCKLSHHAHEGREYMLVLSGALLDGQGRYGRGDIAIADQDRDDRPITDGGEDCLCFTVTDAPLRLTGPIGRVVQRLFGH